jgi:cell shape-determining protein MreD
LSARALIVWSLLALALRALVGVLPEALGRIDPLLAVAVVAALPGRPGLAIGAGLLTGLLDDGWTGDWFGQQALIHMVIAYALSLLAARVDLVQIRPATIVLLLALFADWSMQLLLAAMFDRSVGAPPGAVNWLIAACGTVVVGLIVRRAALGEASG